MRRISIRQRAAQAALPVLPMLLASHALGGTQTNTRDITISFTNNYNVTSPTATILSGTPTFIPFDQYLGRLTAATIDYSVSGSVYMQDKAVGGTPFAIGTITTNFQGKSNSVNYDIEDGSQRLAPVPALTGTASVNLAAATGMDNYSIGPLTTTLTLQQGLYPLVVNPTANFNATLTYTYDNSPAQLTAPTTVDFGNTLVGVPSTQNVTVTNSGGLPTTAVFSKAFQSTAFSPATNSTPINVFGGDSLSRPYTHTGTVRGQDLGYIVVYDAANNPTEVFLQGNSVAPVAALSTSKLDFGNIRTGTTMSDVLSVYNNGDGSLANAGDAGKLSAHVNIPTGPFSLTGSPDSLVNDAYAVGAGNNLHLYIYNFSPTTRGPISQVVNVHTDNGNPDSTNTAADLASKLSGNGVGPVFQVASHIPGQNISFGSTDASTLMLDVKNITSDGALGNLDSLTFFASILNDPDHAFSIVGSAGATLTAAGDDNIQVMFDPTKIPAGQSYQALLSFNTDQDAAFGNLNGDAFSFPLVVPASVPEPSVIVCCFAMGLGLMLRRNRA